MARRCLRAFTALVLALSALLPTVPAQAQSLQVTDRDGGAKHQLTVALHAQWAAGGAPLVDLTLEATPLLPAPALVLQWSLPNGGELLGGDATENLGTVAPNQTVSRARQVRFAAAGVYTVMAVAGYQPDAAMQYSAAGVLFVTVGDDGTIAVSDQDPNATSPMHSQMATTVTRVDDAVGAAAPHAPNGDPCFNIVGTVMRIDREPTQSGYAPNRSVPVRFAQLKMREEDTLFDDTYGEKTTDAAGNYAFSFCDDDGIFDDTLELYVRLRAELTVNGNDVVMVEDSSWIDEVYEYDSAIVESDGGNYRIDFNLNLEQSAVFNIADAVFEAWQTWNESGGAAGSDAIFDGEAEVHWEPGYGDSGSYFNGDTWNEMTIADGPSDPDQWDDSVIMHEWGHMADDYYGCDDNSGGPHNIDTLVSDLELAWGEGYPDYFQSAVRAAKGHTDPSFYLDFNASGNSGIVVDLEQYDSTRMVSLLSDRNELAIAAMLWDLNDNSNDGRTTAGVTNAPFDRVAHGHALLQQVYTDPSFSANGDIFDDTCTSFVYLWSWLKLNKPTDGGTAEAVTKNIGRANPFFGGNGKVAAAGSAQVDAAPRPEDYRWWKQLTFVVDDSKSMAGTKFEAAKTAIIEQINDLTPDPKGIEVNLYKFNNTGGNVQEGFRGNFFAADIAPQVTALAPQGAADPGCYVNAFAPLAQAVADKRGGQAWLYTDGETVQSPSVPALKQLLNARQVRASFVLMGGCASPATPLPNVGGDATTYLGLAADGSQPSGIVPYLLTALGSGGQFLFVGPNQLSDASAILRAQLSQSAGAGKWSDYVSNKFTYRWDRLEAGEYQWFPAESLGQDAGQLDVALKQINLPQPFSYYGASTSVVGVTEDGTIAMNPCFGTAQFCNFRFYFKYLDNLATDMQWAYIPFPPRLAAAPNAGDAVAPASVAEFGPQVHVYTAGLGINDWYIISTQGIANYGGGGTAYRAYQVWLNFQTGEIRYLYDRLRNEAASAEIGLRQVSIFPLPGSTDKLLVSNKDVFGAFNGMGYKFTPAPPQPVKTYKIQADGLMDSIGFLLTGYSGTVAPLAVKDPAGVAVDCADTVNVLCLNLGLVQYVQVQLNGRTGLWQADVTAGPSGEATFSFNAFAASSLQADSLGQRLLTANRVAPLQLNLHRATDTNTLTGWFQRPNGTPFGAEFTLYDDGSHSDQLPGDGIFGLPDFLTPGVGAGYLWVRGTAGAVDFTRADAVPYSFQPLAVDALPKDFDHDGNPANPVAVPFWVTNSDNVAHCFDGDVSLPNGWSYDWDWDQLGCTSVPAGATVVHYLTVYPDWPGAASGETAEVTAAFIETDRGAISDSDTVTFHRYRPATQILIDNRYSNLALRPDGADVALLDVRVKDELGNDVADGTPVTFAATQGSLDVANAFTKQGRIQINFTTGPGEGDALITASSGAATATTTLYVRAPLADALELVVAPGALPVDGVPATATATVRDRWGTPLANQIVLIGVEGDAQQGTLDGGNEVIRATTNDQGQVSATFTKVAGALGLVGIRAQVLYDEGSGEQVALEQRKTIDLGTPVGAGGPNPLFLPLVLRQ